MERLAIIVAATKGSLGAVAAARGCTIIEATPMEFATLSTFKDPPMGNAGDIDVGEIGWVALAIRN